MKNNDWKDRLGMVYSTNPDFNFDSETEEQETLPKNQQKLRVFYYHHRGFILTEKVLSEGKFLRPIYDESAKCYRMSWSDFVRMLEGIVPGKEYYRPTRCSEQDCESDLGQGVKS